jgi:hypothetical protein
VTETEQKIANLEAVRASARLNAPDRYYAALFAPAAVRDDLIALAAFCGEIARIGRQVSEPVMGEIRITWWRDPCAGSLCRCACRRRGAKQRAARYRRNTIGACGSDPTCRG